MPNYPPLAWFVRRFRILRDWKVRWTKEVINGVGINGKERRAFVGRWSGPGLEPALYRPHEVCHIAVRALCLIDRRKGRELYEAEEQFVQDMCGMVEWLAEQRLLECFEEGGG